MDAIPVLGEHEVSSNISPGAEPVAQQHWSA
jgi:hypothetical protein